MTTVYMASLGCARNQIDSEVMLGRLAGAGCTLTREPEDADVIVVNTCSFIEDAVNESIDAILELAAFKEKGHCRRLIVAGCLPERYREDLATELPEVDLFLGTGAFDRIADAVMSTSPPERCLLPDPDAIIPQDPLAFRSLSTPHMAYIKIAEGCSRHCTYCIIPRLRGRQKSRQLPDILKEVDEVVSNGAREIVLVAQDTTHYGTDQPGHPGLDQLLKELAQQHPDRWIRFLYGHPESIRLEVIQAVRDHENLCSYFDIPIQHASEPVLRRMGRHYTSGDLLALFGRIRRRLPEAALRTTVISGFPGETDDDHQQLLACVKKVAFDHLGVFTYSDADDLPSHRLPDHVPGDIAQRRRDELMTVQQSIVEEKNQRRIGHTYDVIIDEASEPGLYIGRTRFQAPEVDGLTFVHARGMTAGDIIPVRITDVLTYDLVGEPA